MDEKEKELLTEEQRERAREYFAQNREKLLEKARERYRSNHDKYLAMARERRKKNREHRREIEKKNYSPEKRKQYYKEHRDRIRELRKASDERHREDIKTRNQTYYEAHRDELVQKEREKRAQDPAVVAARERRELFRGRPWLRRIWWNFRAMISWEDFKRIAPQVEAGPCDICGKTGERMRFDHDHKTLKFRGLLCHGCNVSLGQFKDDPVLLQKAIAYLQKAVEVAS